MTGIQQAVAKAGGQTRLAELLGVSRQAVSHMVKVGYAPLSRAVEIESQLGVPRAELVHPKIKDALL